MARVTVTQLRLVVGPGATDAELSAFIDDASLWVDTKLVGACPELTDAILAGVEKYVAAHYSSLRYPTRASVKIGDTSESFAGPSNRTSSYLEAAAALDPCGIVRTELVDPEKPRGLFRVGAGYDPRHTGGGS